MTLAPGDRVKFAFVHNAEGEAVLCTDMGYLKRCLLIDFDRQARGGKGVKCFTMPEKRLKRQLHCRRAAGDRSV